MTPENILDLVIKYSEPQHAVNLPESIIDFEQTANLVLLLERCILVHELG